MNIRDNLITIIDNDGFKMTLSLPNDPHKYIYHYEALFRMNDIYEGYILDDVDLDCLSGYNLAENISKKGMIVIIPLEIFIPTGSLLITIPSEPSLEQIKYLKEIENQLKDKNNAVYVCNTDYTLYDEYDVVGVIDKVINKKI